MTQPQSQPSVESNQPPHTPLVIGVCGGVASGKSVVTQQLAKLGAAVIHADQIGHAVLRDPEVIHLLLEHFGQEIRSREEPNQLSRAAIAAIVFGSSETAQAHRDFLESVTHPRIRQSIRDQLKQFRQHNTPPPAIVLDVPLLFESGWYTECDEIIFVQAPYAERLQRATERGWQIEQFHAREAAQLDLAEKEKRSSVILYNTGTLAEFQNRISDWFLKRQTKPSRD